MTVSVIMLQAAASGLREFNKFFQNEMLPQIRQSSLSDACSDYKAVRDAYEVVDEHRKKLGELLEGLNRDTIPTMMEDSKTPSLKVECADGHFYRFVRSQRISVSMLDKDGGFNWLKESGNGGLIQQTVNAQSLGAFAKAWVQEKGQDLPAEYFKLNTMNIVSVTKA